MSKTEGIFTWPADVNRWQGRLIGGQVPKMEGLLNLYL